MGVDCAYLISARFGLKAVIFRLFRHVWIGEVFNHVVGLILEDLVVFLARIIRLALLDHLHVKP